MDNIKVGKKAPDFKCRDHKDEMQSLALHKGQWILLYFYPKDDTPGCIKEACGIRDAWDEFKGSDIMIMGVSADSIASHQRFAGKHELPFRLLADEDKSIIKAYGAWTKKNLAGRGFMGIKRMSVLIDPQGRIAKIYDKVNPQQHAGEVLADIQSFSG